MGGFAVIYNLDGSPADREIFERMLAAIAHRGPDGCGRWVEGPLAMGYQMFHTTPEAVREAQPLADPDGRYHIVFDGRVDNRVELAAAIRAKGVALRDDTDAEIALRAYECFGEDAPRRIVGDFALVIWNGSKRELFCARDPIGIRPFHYYCDGRTFIAATELQQIFADPSVSNAPDEGVVGEYLAGTLKGREYTLFRDIRRLPAAHQMTVGVNGVSKRPYFALDWRKELRYRDDAEYAEHFHEIFGEAVRCRMRAIGGLGAHLSGGLDSTSVVGMASWLRRRGKVADAPFETFSLLFDHPDLDERSYIFETVEMLGLIANYPEPVPVDLPMCVETVRRFRDFTEYPNGGMWNRVWPMARAKGIRVLLSGTGSDEWMSGSPHVYADLSRAGHWRKALAAGTRRFESPAQRTRSRRRRTSFCATRLWPLVPLAIAQVRASSCGIGRSCPISSTRNSPGGSGSRIDCSRKRCRPAGMTFGQFVLYESFQQRMGRARRRHLRSFDRAVTESRNVIRFTIGGCTNS